MKTMTTSEVAQMLLAMFPPTSKYLERETCIYSEDGNAAVHAVEKESGCSKVRGSLIGWQGYAKLKANKKKAVVENIKNIKVDKVTEILVFHDNSTMTSIQYFVAGAFEKYLLKKSYLIKSYTIEPFNY